MVLIPVFIHRLVYHIRQTYATALTKLEKEAYFKTIEQKVNWTQAEPTEQ